MAQAASKTLGDSLECGVICTKYGHCRGKLPKITCCEGGHPIPDENSLRATDAALSLVQGLTAQVRFYSCFRAAAARFSRSR